MTAPLNGTEAPDLKNNSVGVGKRMLVRPLDVDTVLRTRDNASALTAADIRLLLQHLLLGFLFDQPHGHLMVFFFRRNTKQIGGNRIKRNHFLPSLDLVHFTVFLFIRFKLHCFRPDFNIVLPYLK